jgi:hypothetical protein
VAIELNRMGKRQDHFSLPWEALFSVIRGIGFAAGLYRILGFGYAAAFGALITVAQVAAYSRGMRPSLDYAAARQLRFTRRLAVGTVRRAVGYTAAALVCSALVRHVEHPWLFAMRLGLVTGVVTAVGVAVNPYIEYYADNLPERRLGAFGIWLVFCGFLLQSFQYVAVLLDIPVT